MCSIAVQPNFSLCATVVCLISLRIGDVTIYSPVNNLYTSVGIQQYIDVQSKDLRGNPKPRVSPDRTGLKPVRDRGTFLRIFSGRVGSGNFILGRSESGNFISGRSGSGYFLPGHETFSPGISWINLPFIPRRRMVIILDKHVVWCYNFIVGHIHVFIVVWNLIWSLNIWSQHKLSSIPQNFQVGLDRNLLISGWC